MLSLASTLIYEHYLALLAYTTVSIAIHYEFPKVSQRDRCGWILDSDLYAGRCGTSVTNVAFLPEVLLE